MRRSSVRRTTKLTQVVIHSGSFRSTSQIRRVCWIESRFGLIVDDPGLDVSVRPHRGDAGEKEGGKDGKGFRLGVSYLDVGRESTRLTLYTIV